MSCCFYMAFNLKNIYCFFEKKVRTHNTQENTVVLGTRVLNSKNV